METETPTTEAQPERKTTSLLAREVFGNDYYGEVKDAPEEDAQDSLEMEAEEVDADTEVAAEAEPEITEDEQETPISSFSELAEYLETDGDFLSNLEIDVKVNGEPGRAKLADLVASYQTQDAATKRLEDAKAKAKEITTSLAEQERQIQEKLAVAASLIDDQRKQLADEEAGIDWARLKRVDPADYSAKKLDFQERKAALEGKISKAVQTYQESVQTNQAKMQEEQEKYLAKEAQALLEKIPEWKDQEKAKTEKAAISEFLMNNGMTPEEISSVSDHRLVLIARDAMLYRKSMDKNEPSKKRLLTIPKTLKPGTKKAVGDDSQTEIAKVRKLLKSTGDEKYLLELNRLKRKANRG